jgi:long-chain acyl-CoA synthetase
VVIWDPKGLWGFSQERVIFFDEFLKRSKTYLEQHRLCGPASGGNPAEDTAMIIYTSGTTGRPKGAMDQATTTS